jgi:hypothetical protein
MKQETLEEVLGSSMCEFSVIENKLAILYRNQVKIYEAIINQQAEIMYSEEEVLDMLKFFTKDTRGDKPWVDADDEWFEQFKKK